AGPARGPSRLGVHPHGARRQGVAAPRGRALDTVPVAPPPMPPMDVDTARKRREQLSAYAEAMNRTRDPLGYSLHDILGALANQSTVPDAPATGLAPVADLTVEGFSEIRQTAAGEDQAARAAGVPWSAIPQSGMLPAVGGAALAGLAPPCADPGGLTAEQISGLSRAFAADADMLQERLGTLSSLASMLGLRAPVTFSDAADLLAIAELAGEPDRPERGWLSVPGYQATSEAGRALYDAHRALARAAADASAYFTPEVLQHDVHGLADRFSGEHLGLGKLSGEYRADKRAVAAFTRDDIARETADH